MEEDSGQPITEMSVLERKGPTAFGENKQDIIRVSGIEITRGPQMPDGTTEERGPFIILKGIF